MSRPPTSTQRPPRSAIILLLAVLAMVGCVRGSGNVTGVVKFQEKPLQAGTVVFYDETNVVRESQIGEDGSYTVTNVATGKARIAVMTPMVVPMKGMEIPNAGKAVAIPAKYAAPETSGLTFEVGLGTKTHNIDLLP